MKIFRLRMVWERLAREDPYWAVLTDPEKEGNRWRAEEFFQTGRDEVTAAMAHLATYAPDAPRDTALDFGCGVGRLTQALGSYYAHTTGVDVARGMIDLARRHAGSLPSVTFTHNPHDDLRQFADASFDLVFSLITLQHIPAELGLNYVREFVRIARPGAVLYFQIPTVARQGPAEIKRWSLYPPTMFKRIKRWTLRWFRLKTGLGDEMHMHPVPEPTVRAMLTAAGAQLVTTLEHPMGPDCESLIYIARRR